MFLLIYEMARKNVFFQNIGFWTIFYCTFSKSPKFKLPRKFSKPVI